MSVFTPFVSGAKLYASQLNVALNAIIALVTTATNTANSAAGAASTAQAGANSAASTALSAEALATTAAAAAAAAQTKANAAVLKVNNVAPDGSGNVTIAAGVGTVTHVGGIAPDGGGNVVLTPASLPISAGTGIAIDGAGVISAAGGGAMASPFFGPLTKPMAADFNGPGVSMAGATFVDSASGPVLTVPITSGQKVVGPTINRTSAAGGPFTVEVVLNCSWNTQENNIGFGIITHNAAGGGGSMHTDFWGAVHDGNGFIYDLIRLFSDGSNNSGLNSGQLRFVPSNIVRLKLIYDGAILRLYRSNNGEDNMSLLQDLDISNYPMTSVGIGVWSNLPDTATASFPLVCQVLSITPQP